MEMEDRSQPSRPPGEKSIADALKWIVFLPAALVGGYICKFAVLIGLAFVIPKFSDSEPVYDFTYTSVMIISNAVWGAATVYIAAWIEPAYKKSVAVAVCGFVILLAVIFAAGEPAYSPISGLISMIGGAVVATYSIHKGNLMLDKVGN